MVKGLSFKILNEQGKYLFDILESISITKYNWQCIDAEVYDNRYENLFNKDTINGEELNRIISKQNYYIVNIQLEAYEKIEDRKEIKLYTDFIKSDCEIMLCIYDSEFCEIYFKNEELLNKEYKILEKKNFNPVYITEKNIRERISIF